ncbi:MAG TPA: hypothetical protein QGF05_11990 [Dehalococcoidia bacterium]|nr:hypothetical protein [Dehalococcoidia bacterium]
MPSEDETKPRSAPVCCPTAPNPITPGRTAEEVIRVFTLERDPSDVRADPNDPNWYRLPIEALFLSDRIEITVKEKDGKPIAFSARDDFEPFLG